MNKPDWKDAPEWATHLIVKRKDPGRGNYFFAFYDGIDFKHTKDGHLCFHPEAYDIVSTRQ